MLWFLRSLRRGVVTTRYPAETDGWAATLPNAPAFRGSLLTEELADRLQAVCPSGALRHDPGVLVVDLGACTGCGHCIEAGEGAVESSREFLLAARGRDDLIKRLPLNGTAGSARASAVGSEHDR